MTPPLAAVAGTDLTRAPQTPHVALSVLGQIDSVTPRGVVKGWCAALPAPSHPRRIVIALAGRPVLEHILCDEFRPDLSEAGYGDGRHGFTARLPETLAAPGQAQEIHLFDQETGVPLGSPATIVWAAPGACPPALEAHVDSVSEEGVITGWCWDRNDPDRRVVIDILADGKPCTSAVAAMYREDLKAAGKGSGHCGFSAVLPWEVVDGRGEVSLVLQDREHGVPVGARATLRRPDLLTAEARIAVLERKLTLLRGEIAGTRESAAARAATDAVAVTFRMIARFFEDLAAGRRPASDLDGLRAQMEHAARSYPLLPFGLPATPEATIFILPDGRLESLYACLKSLHRSGVDQSARVYVLDPTGGVSEDVMCLHAISRNVHAILPRPSETLNDVLASVPTPYVALLHAGDLVPVGWLDALLASLRNGQAGLAGGAQGLHADEEQGLLRAAHDEPAAAALSVDALDGTPLLVDRHTLLEAGGLDLSYRDPGVQLLALALRLRDLGHTVLHVPAAAPVSETGTRSFLDDVTAEDMPRLLAHSRRLAGAERPDPARPISAARRNSARPRGA